MASTFLTDFLSSTLTGLTYGRTLAASLVVDLDLLTYSTAFLVDLFSVYFALEGEVCFLASTCFFFDSFS